MMSLHCYCLCSSDAAGRSENESSAEEVELLRQLDLEDASEGGNDFSLVSPTTSVDALPGRGGESVSLSPGLPLLPGTRSGVDFTSGGGEMEVGVTAHMRCAMQAGALLSTNDAFCTNLSHHSLGHPLR
jgi:hypothetical protein